MTIEDFQILTHDKIQKLIEANLFQDPANFALTYRNNDVPTVLVSSQLKYLQKSKKKIPSFYKSRCIIPPLAFEQASSEQSAGMKSFVGKRCLDLTCGLGVDVLHFAQNFEYVDAVDIDPVKVEIARYNFQKMGISHVTFYPEDANDYVSTYAGSPYDLIYLDPARRSKEGHKTYAPEDCYPNIFELLPKLWRIGKKVLVKLSPLYDQVEAFRKFPQLRCFHIYSVDNEVKEVLLELDEQVNETPQIKVKAYRSEMIHTYDFAWDEVIGGDFSKGPFSYIWDVDVAFWKGRLVERFFQEYMPHVSGFMEPGGGFFFAPDVPGTEFSGRVFKVEAQFPYKPKLLKKYFKSAGIKRAEIIQRNFPFPTKAIRKELQLSPGGEIYVLACMLKGEKTVFICSRIK